MKPYYQDDAVTIYHGDCWEVVTSLVGEVAAVITDPPYGIRYKSWQRQDDLFDSVAGDEALDLSWLGRCRHLTPPGVRTSAYIFASDDSLVATRMGVEAEGWATNTLLVWDKQAWSGGSDGAFAVRTEFIVYATNNTVRKLNGSRDHNLISIPRVDTRRRHHPTEKPVDLMAYLVLKSTDAGELVLDPFMGSGPSLVAAKRLGRKAIGVEIEERYCEIAAKRCAQEVLAL